MLLAPVILFMFIGCAASAPDAGEKEPSFPTKSVENKEFTFDKFDKERAVRAFRKLRASMLFELIVDRQGKVVNIRVLKTKLDDYPSYSFKGYVSQIKFSPAPGHDPYPYRALFYPLKTGVEIEAR